MNRHILRSLVVMSLAVGAAAITSYYLSYRKVLAQSGRLELTATSTLSAYDPSNTEGRREIKVYATRKDGSRAQWTRKYLATNWNVPIAETRRVLDIGDKRDVGIDPLTQSLTSAPLSSAQVAAYTLPPDSSCSVAINREDPNATVAAHPDPPSLLGYPVVEVTHWDTIRGTRHLARQEWLAPQLECLKLRQVATFRDDASGLSARNEEDVTSVTIGPPDPGLFVIPSDYTERAPSQVFAAAARVRGEPECRECEKVSTKALDDAYHRRRGEMR
jgi:hypothetical protein